MAFPSIDIEVQGKIIPVLFDTGASAWPSDAAKPILGLDGTRVATSFIVASIFDEWRQKNSDWLVIENACTFSNEPMIRVPKLKIGDVIIGPVWFTRREDSNFHNYMSSMMDRKIEGAIGGSTLKYTRVVIDYPNEVAYISDK